jgi:hypothetical protein
MMPAERFRLPAAATIVVLVAAMPVEATVIGGWFMHLRYERLR